MYLMPVCNQVHILYSWDNQTSLQKLKMSGLLSYMTCYLSQETSFQYFICPWVRGVYSLEAFCLEALFVFSDLLYYVQ